MPNDFSAIPVFIFIYSIAVFLKKVCIFVNENKKTVYEEIK
jgi:uncharacterized membrane protein